jgi:CheY-like chemotaxis protein
MHIRFEADSSTSAGLVCLMWRSASIFWVGPFTSKVFLTRGRALTSVSLTIRHRKNKWMKSKPVFMEGGEEDRHAALEHNDKIRILVADDHVVMREGLAGILRNQPDLEVVAQAENGIEAVQMADRTVPDVILMDITMPEMDGIAATKEISKKYPRTRIIGLSMHDDPSVEERMRDAGACAYIYKASPSDELLQAIRMSVDR